MGTKIKKIYFVHTDLLSFVRKDLEILNEKHEVKAVNNSKLTLSKIPENLFGVLWCDLVLCWFGSLRFIFPILLGRLLNKKVVIVAGGYDVVRLPEIGYGGMRKDLGSWVRKQLLRFADKIICISESNKREAIENAGIPSNKITMIYHGFKPIPQQGNEPKHNLVITVGSVSKRNLYRKGLKLFIEAARLFPETPFVMVGEIREDALKVIQKVAPRNLKMTGYFSRSELTRYLSKAKVYVQASMHEGFGCSVAEAMQSGCIPVVSDVFALPEVVGDSGYIFRNQNLQDMKEKIQLAMNDDGNMTEKARKRVKEVFAFESRRRKLLHVIDSL